MVIRLRRFMLTTHKKQAEKAAFYLPVAEVVAPHMPCTAAESSLYPYDLSTKLKRRAGKNAESYVIGMSAGPHK